MCVDLVRCSVPISFAKKSDLRTPKYGTVSSTLLFRKEMLLLKNVPLLAKSQAKALSGTQRLGGLGGCCLAQSACFGAQPGCYPARTRPPSSLRVECPGTARLHRGCPSFPGPSERQRVAGSVAFTLLIMWDSGFRVLEIMRMCRIRREMVEPFSRFHRLARQNASSLHPSSCHPLKYRKPPISTTRDIKLNHAIRQGTTQANGTKPSY